MATSTIKINPINNGGVAYSRATLNSSYFSHGNVMYCKIGNIVILTISDLILNANVTGGIVTDLITGLPSPVEGFSFLVSRYDTDETWRLFINTNGMIQSHYDAQTASQAQWYGNFTYITRQ